MKHCEGTGLFSDRHYSFHTFKPTAYLLNVFCEYIYKALGVGGETRIISTNILKAFGKAYIIVT